MVPDRSSTPGSSQAHLMSHGLHRPVCDVVQSFIHRLLRAAPEMRFQVLPTTPHSCTARR